MAEKLRRNLWILVVPILLLTVAQVKHRLEGFPLDSDELITVRFSLGGQDSPLRINEVWNAVIQISPDQSLGFPLLLAFWRRVFGWGEFSLRLMPLYAGLLALCWIYRVGRDLFAPLVGLLALILLSTSVYFVTYLHVARPYSMVVLFALMIIWAYWRLTVRPEKDQPDRAGQLCFLLGSVGLFYSHYYAVLLLAALALWHYWFVVKDRRWWQPVYLFALATLVALPQFIGFVRGIHFVQTQFWHNSPVLMRTTEAVPWLLRVITNGALRLPSVKMPVPTNIVLLVFLSLFLILGWWRLRKLNRFRELHFLPFTGIAVLLMVLIVNEILLLLNDDRFRYFMVLWPLSALILGWCVWRSQGNFRLILGTATMVFVFYGIWANVASELRYEFYYPLYRDPIQTYLRKAEDFSAYTDLIVVNERLYDRAHSFDFTHFPESLLRLPLWQDSSDTKAELFREVRGQLRFWMMADILDEEEYHSMTSNLPADVLFCKRIVDQEHMVLELYSWSPVHCPSDEPAEMRFGEEIELAASGVELVTADTLRVDLLLHSDEITAMTAYSVAIHVFAVETGEKAAQGDQGLWLGRYNPVRSEIDISALTPGEYEVRIGLYNWQTLERLEGVDLASGVAANLLPLSRFRVE